MDELTAYHESGHAVVAVVLGGQIDFVSIEIADDAAAGATAVRWNGAADDPQIVSNSLRVALAGPIAEMVFVGDYDYLRIKAEHEIDWQVVSAAIQSMDLAPEKVTPFLQQCAAELYQQIRTDSLWSAIGDIADRLQIDGSLDGQSVTETVQFWLRRI